MNTEIQLAQDVVIGDYIFHEKTIGLVSDIATALNHTKVLIAVDKQRNFVEIPKLEKVRVKQR